MSEQETGEITEGAPASDVDVTPESSPEQASEQGLMSVIDKVLDGKEASPTSEQEPDKSASEEETDKEGAKDELPDEPTEQELKDATPKTAKRIQTLLGERHELRQQVQTLQKDADQWRQVERFREEKGLTPQEVANSIQIAALMREDPGKALEILAPVWASLQQQAGAVLSPDLEQAVRRGDMTREAAHRLVQAQASAEHSRAQLERQQTAQQKAQEEQRHRQHTDSIVSASTAWEQNWRSRDPDFEAKQDMVAQIADLRMRTDGFPESPEKMHQILDDALKQVNGFMGKVVPQKPRIAPPATSASSRVSTTANARPTSYMEALESALNG